MTDAHFNADALFAEYGDESLIEELAVLLLEQADGQLIAVHNAIARGDARSLMAAAHKIKGGMGTFRVTSVTHLALALEALGRNDRLAEAAPLAAQLDRDIRTLCDSARVWLAGRAA